MIAMKASGRCTTGIAAIGLLGVVTAPLPASADAVLLSQKPAQAAAAMQFEAPTSTIAPIVAVPYDLVETAANAAADRFAGPRSGKTQIGCQNITFGASLPVKLILFHGCADFDWNVTAARNGGITVKKQGDGIAMEVPVKFTGDGSFEGDLAKAIRTGQQHFSGTFTVSISGSVAVNKSFCPVVENAAAHFAWGAAPDIDVIGRSCLGVGHGLHACIGPWKFPAGQMLTDQINHSLASQVDEINKKIPCNAIRGQLQQVWKNWSIPVPIVNPPVYVSIQPKALSVSGVTATDNGLQVAARLDAATGVSAAPAPVSGPLPLPENTPVAAPASRFALAVPLPVPYPLLAAAGAGGIVGKRIQAGKAAITPTEIEIFPDHQQLAVGVTLRDDGRGPFLGKTGTVWFLTTPTVDDNGHAIRLSNVTMTQPTGAPLWGAVSAAVDPQLPQALAKSYSYDFSGLLQQARSTLDRALADPKNTGGVQISVTNDDLRLGKTANLPNSFVIEGLFDADVGATLQSPPQAAKL